MPVLYESRPRAYVDRSTRRGRSLARGEAAPGKRPTEHGMPGHSSAVERAFLRGDEEAAFRARGGRTYADMTTDERAQLLAEHDARIAKREADAELERRATALRAKRALAALIRNTVDPVERERLFDALVEAQNGDDPEVAALARGAMPATLVRVKPQ